jgi:hypothetical protein
MCLRGDTCQYAHGVFESWLHPSRWGLAGAARTAPANQGARGQQPGRAWFAAWVRIRGPWYFGVCGLPSGHVPEAPVAQAG